MLYERVCVSEHPATYPTVIRLLLGVHATVFFQVTLQGERCAAHFALEGTLPGVRSRVPIQVGLADKALLTVSTHKLLGLFVAPTGLGGGPAPTRVGQDRVGAEGRRHPRNLGETPRCQQGRHRLQTGPREHGQFIPVVLRLKGQIYFVGLAKRKTIETMGVIMVAKKVVQQTPRGNKYKPARLSPTHYPLDHPVPSKLVDGMS